MYDDKSKPAKTEVSISWEYANLLVGAVLTRQTHDSVQEGNAGAKQEALRMTIHKLKNSIDYIGKQIL